MCEPAVRGTCEAGMGGHRGRRAQSLKNGSCSPPEPAGAAPVSRVGQEQAALIEGLRLGSSLEGAGHGLASAGRPQPPPVTRADLSVPLLDGAPLPGP